MAGGASDRHWLKARRINELTYLLTYRQCLKYSSMRKRTFCHFD